jgi:hypothetical protein
LKGIQLEVLFRSPDILIVEAGKVETKQEASNHERKKVYPAGAKGLPAVVRLNFAISGGLSSALNSSLAASRKLFG